MVCGSNGGLAVPWVGDEWNFPIRFSCAFIRGIRADQRIRVLGTGSQGTRFIYFGSVLGINGSVANGEKGGKKGMREEGEEGGKEGRMEGRRRNGGRERRTRKGRRREI